VSEPTRHDKMVNAAVWLAEQGFADIGWAPCSDGKAPNRKWKSDATDDPALIRMMLRPGRNALVIPKGKAAVVDVDDPATVATLAHAGMPAGFRVESPTPGHGHFYVWQNGIEPPTTFSGGEIRRGGSGMVLGPWALRTDGVYTPNTTHIIPELPTAVAELLLALRREKQEREGKARGPQDDGWQIIHGRHDFLTSKARNLRGVGLTGERLVDELLRLRDERCSAPGGRVIEDKEIRLVVEWVMENITDDRPEVGFRTDDHLKGRSAAELLATDQPPLRQALAGLLPEGLGVLGAPPKAGKSLLAYQLAVELIFGGELFGIEAERRDVLYYALEDGPRRSQGRIRALLLGRMAGLDRFELRWTAPRLGGPLEDEVAGWLDEHPIGVVIVDVLSKVRASGRAGLNAYDEDYAAIAGLHTAARRHPGSVVLLVTHDRKAGSDDWMTRVTGTRGVTGAADFVIFISRKRTEMIGTIFVTGRDTEDSAFDVEFTGGGWRLADIAQVIGTKSPTRQTIFNYVSENGPVWQKAIAEGTGLSETVVYNRVSDMSRDGELVGGPQGYEVPE
jgi:hypothetical protein